VYDAFSSISYPLASIAGNSSQIDALRKTLVDFKIYVTGDSFVEAPFVELVSLHKAPGQPLRVRINLLVGPNVIGNPVLEFADDAYATQEYVRYHFDSQDFPTLAAYSVEGYICFSNLQNLFTPFAASEPIFVYAAFEPSTAVALCKQRVNEITCRSALPLLQQTDTLRYTDESQPVVGDVKLVAGDNCTISVLTNTRTVIIGAQQGANDSQAEQCGPWVEKINSKDILCNEGIYSISGVEPDANGDVKIVAQSPLAVSAFTRAELNAVNADFLNSSVLSGFPHIIRFIYVGLPQSSDNPNVFNCQ
jgi:hypothetical protein